MEYYTWFKKNLINATVGLMQIDMMFSDTKEYILYDPIYEKLKNGQNIYEKEWTKLKYGERSQVVLVCDVGGYLFGIVTREPSGVLEMVYGCGWKLYEWGYVCMDLTVPYM